MLTRRHIVLPVPKLDESKDFIVTLIASVEKRRCLWDTTSRNYSRRDKLEAAWRDVAKELRKPEKLVKEKWKNVRTGFLRSLKDFTPSGVKRRPFYLHNEMKFLLKTVPPKPIENFPELYTSESTMEQPDHFHPENIKKIYEANRISVDHMQDNMEDNMSSKFSEAMEFFSEDIEPQEAPQKCIVSPLLKQERSAKKRKSSLDADTSIINYLKTRSRQSMQPVEESALKSFFKGVVPDVLSLSVSNQRLFKRKLLELIDDLHQQEESLPKKRNTFFWTDQHLPEPEINASLSAEEIDEE